MAAREQGIALLIAETSVHCGVGQDVGAIDLPIQRDKVTGTPVIYGSSLKGGWRDAVDRDKATGLFGPRVDDDSKAPLSRGAVGVGEARVLFYPVPSVAGLFAYVTSPGELARLRRGCTVAGVAGPPRWPAEAPGDGAALVSGSALRFGAGAGAGQQVVALGEYTLAATESEELRELGEWVAEKLLSGKEFDYWRRALASQTVLVCDDQFRAFVSPAVVVTRVQLEEGKKTVKTGGLLTEEVLPADVILWAGLNADEGGLDRLAAALPVVVTVGGDETIGRGVLRHAILPGAAA